MLKKCKHINKEEKWIYLPDTKEPIYNEFFDTVQLEREKVIVCKDCGKILEEKEKQIVFLDTLEDELKENFCKNKEILEEKDIKKYNNEFVLYLDRNFKYNIKDLEKELFKQFSMSLEDESFSNDVDILFYDGCRIILEKTKYWQKLIISTNYFCMDKDGKYITKINSNILSVIENWSKETYQNNK